MNIAGITKEYKLKSLREQDIQSDPVDQFTQWWNEAVESKVDEINAMTLGTTANDKPSARIVLLKGFHSEGFIFFTNYESRKGTELKENPNACLLFFWKELERQVRIEGTVQKVSEEESDLYFFTRPEESRISAWSSPQSRVIKNREVLEKNAAEYREKFSKEKIPRPANWGGYILKPGCIEFWQGRPGRLHDRLQYTLRNNSWIIERLAP